MILAIGATLLYRGIVDYKWIVIGLVLGTIIGIPAGARADDGSPATNGIEPTPSVRCAWRWSAPRNTICARLTSRSS